MEKLKAIDERWRRCRIVEVLAKRHWDSIAEMNRDTKYLTRINLILSGTNAILFLLHLGLHLSSV